MKCLLAILTVFSLTHAIKVKFDDMFGGMREISIPSCQAEPCRIKQGDPLITYLTFCAESTLVDQKKISKFTNGYLGTFMNGYGNMFGTGLTTNSDLAFYGTTFPIRPKQIAKARVPLIAPKIDPKIGPFKSTGKKRMQYLINLGNATDFISIASASIDLFVVH